MDGLLARVFQSLRYRIFEKNRLRFGRYQFNKVLNKGERYDPTVGERMGWREPSHRSRYEFAKRCLRKEDTVLDIACGTGYGTAILSDACKKAIGVDSSPVAIRYANRKYARPNTEFVVSTFETSTVAADVVVSFETIEHLETENIDPLLERLASFAGRLLIGSVPYREPRSNNPYHHIFDLQEGSLTVLSKLGDLAFHYQDADGQIHASPPDDVPVVNLLFVLRKRTER